MIFTIEDTRGDEPKLVHATSSLDALLKRFRDHGYRLCGDEVSELIDGNPIDMAWDSPLTLHESESFRVTPWEVL